MNAITEAYGFSFHVPPEVEWSSGIDSDEGVASLTTKRFVSRAKIQGAERHGDLDTLAMLLLDTDYDGDVFALDLLRRTNWRINRFTAWRYCALACDHPSEDNSSQKN